MSPSQAEEFSARLFQLGLTRDFFHSARNRKIGRKRVEISISFLWLIILVKTVYIENLIANVSFYALSWPKLNFGWYLTFEINGKMNK